MPRFADKYRIESTRLNNWNYSTPGIYFITICTYNHNNFFGKIINGKMELSDRGQIAVAQLIKTISIRKSLIIDPWVVMPNHVHLLITIRDIPVETHCHASLHENSDMPFIIHSHRNHPDFYRDINSKSIQTISQTIKSFKGSVKRICKQQNIYFSWQPRFYDEIIHDEKRLNQIKYYIVNNAKNWQKDKLFSLK